MYNIYSISTICNHYRGDNEFKRLGLLMFHLILLNHPIRFIDITESRFILTHRSLT